MDQLTNIEQLQQQDPEFVPEKRDPRALNAYRHGLTGQIHISTKEEQQAYSAHCTRITEDLAPVGGMEEELVQAICDDRWRMKRAFSIEESIFAAEISRPDDAQNLVDIGHDQVDAAIATGQAWLRDAKQLNLLGLYESRFQRRVEKNLAMLKKLQAEREDKLEKAAEELARILDEADNKRETFDPDKLPLVFSLPEVTRRAALIRRLKRVHKPRPARETHWQAA